MTAPAVVDDAVSIAPAKKPRGRAKAATSWDTAHEGPNGEQVIQLLPTDLIEGHPDNPRQDLGELTDLVLSIKAHGVIQPLTVVPAAAMRAAAGEVDPIHDGRYVLVAGHRRHAAAARAGLGSVPCIVRPDLVGQAAVEVMLIENLQRVDLNPLEEARGFARLEELGLSQRQIAERVGCNQSNVSKKIGLIKLPAAAAILIEQGQLSVTNATALLPLAEHPTRLLAAMRETTSYGGVGGAVDRHLKEIKDEAKISAIREELKAKGLRVVKAPAYEQWTAKMMPVATLKKAPGVTVPRLHAKEKCHAIALLESGYGLGNQTPVCTAPASHGYKVDRPKSWEEREREDRAKREAAARVAVESRQARAEFLPALVKGKPSRELEALAQEMAVRKLLDQVNSAELEAFAPVIGMPVDVDPIHVEKWFYDEVAKGGAAAARAVAIATVLYLHTGLERAMGQYGRPDDEDGAFLQLLVNAGYTPTLAEKKILDARKPVDQVDLAGDAL